MKQTQHHDKETMDSKTLGDFFSASQLRSDRWTTLKGLAAQLVGASQTKRDKLMPRTQALRTHWVRSKATGPSLASGPCSNCVACLPGETWMHSRRPSRA